MYTVRKRRHIIGMGTIALYCNHIFLFACLPGSSVTVSHREGDQVQELSLHCLQVLDSDECKVGWGSMADRYAN